jgi:hypothetical protein
MLTNTAPQTMWRLEARKSFSLGVKFTNRRDAALDITGCTITFVLAKQQYQGGTVLLTRVLDLLDPTEGIARLNLQAADLDLAPGEYRATITVLTAEGYSAAVVKNDIEILENTDPSVVGTYEGVGWSTSITVALGEQQQLVVKVSNFPAQGPQGERGVAGYEGVILLESYENLSDVPPDTPVGTIIYRKA